MIEYKIDQILYHAILRGKRITVEELKIQDILPVKERFRDQPTIIFAIAPGHAHDHYGLSSTGRQYSTSVMSRFCLTPELALEKLLEVLRAELEKKTDDVKLAEQVLQKMKTEHEESE